MKKLVLSIAFMAVCAFGMNAQLTVLKSGNVRIGTETFSAVLPEKSNIGIIQPDNPLVFRADTLAKLNLLGTGAYKSGAYITFGNEKKVGIGEPAGIGNADSDVLSLFGSKGLNYKADNKVVFSFSSKRVTAPFVFNCDVRGNSFVVNSDSRLKSNISSLDGFSSSLGEISPVSYSLTDAPEATKANASSSDDSIVEKEIAMTPDGRTRFGFIAQEVKEVFPELVIEDENGYLSVDYLGFIPILVDAYKTLESRVKEQDETIAVLSGRKAPQKSSSASASDILDGKATLLQNRPNPFKESTSISCTVPDGSAEAFVCVYDLQGKQVKRLDIEQRGNCSVVVDGSSLQPGMYIYALIIDGAEIDSKKMILTD